MYICVHMVCLHDVVCLSSPFRYIDLNTDDMFQSNIYVYTSSKNITRSISNSSNEYMRYTQEEGGRWERKEKRSRCVCTYSWLYEKKVSIKKDCRLKKHMKQNWTIFPGQMTSTFHSKEPIYFFVLNKISKTIQITKVS